jgi:hypothetical protein
VYVWRTSVALGRECRGIMRKRGKEETVVSMELRAGEME